MTHLVMNLMGSPQIDYAGSPIEVDTRKAIALLVYLALTAEVHTRDTLATLFWPDYDQTRARGALRRTLSSLKKALFGDFLIISRENLSISGGDQLWIDVQKFERNLREQQSHEHEMGFICSTCHSLLDEAIDLYRGDFLEGFTLRDSPKFDDWQFFISEKLRRDLALALEKQVEFHVIQKAYPSAIQRAHEWLALDPLREDAHRALMRCYHWSAQHSSALRQYRECVRILEQELSVPPLEETTQLYNAILENNLPEPESINQRLRDNQLLMQANEAQRIMPWGNYPLVGRSRASELLWRAYQSHSQTGYFFLIEGEPGIGKSRLAEEFLGSVEAGGAKVFIARCYEGDSNLAYEPFVTGLRQLLKRNQNLELLNQVSSAHIAEAARLLPELEPYIHTSYRVPSLIGPGAQARFFEGLHQILLSLVGSSQMGILLIDDLHWMDNASLDFLAYLAHQLSVGPLFILGCWRDESQASTQKLRQIFANSQRDGLAEGLHLERLGLKDVNDLVRSIQIQFPTFSEDFVQRLYSESEGLPFFVVEFLNSMKDGSESKLKVGKTSMEWDLPSRIRDLLNARLSELGEAEQQLIATAAVIGRSFDFNTLWRTSGRSEIETITGLEVLRDRNLVEEGVVHEGQSQIIYDFTHAKLRQLVYEEISQPRKRLLHRRVAEALEHLSRSGFEPGEMANKIANHYQLSNEQDLAAEYHYRAGEYAVQLYAHSEAVVHFQAALSAGYPQPASLHELIGDAQTTLGEYSAALNSYEIAASLLDTPALSRLEGKLGLIHHRRGDYELAACHFKAALDGLEQEDESAMKSRLFADWSRSLHKQGQDDLAKELAQKSLHLAKTANNDRAMAQAYNILGMLERGAGNYKNAREHLENSLTLSEHLSDPIPRMAALNNLGLLSADCMELDRAVVLTRQALTICEKVGDRHYEAALHNNLADLYKKRGDEEQAMARLRQAVVIFAEIGVKTGDLKPEIWMLTEW